MPEPIKKAKAVPGQAAAPKRVTSSSYDTGSVRSEDLFPELRAKKKPSNPALPPVAAKKARKSEETSQKPVAAVVNRSSSARDVAAKRPATPRTGVKVAAAPVRTATPAQGSKVVAAALRKNPTPAKGLKPVAPAPAKAGARPATSARAEEKPRVKLIAGTGIGLTLLFVCLIILNASLQVSAITINERMSVGDVAVRHETWEPRNPIVDINSLDPNVADIDLFLVQDEEDPGYIHFLVDAKKEGEAAILIEYENKDQKILIVTVEPGANEPAPKEDKKSKNDTLERVRTYLRTGDELMQDGDKAVENTYKAFASYQRALRTIKQIRLHQFLPEFKGLEEKIRLAQDQIEVRYKKAEAEYQVARDREMHWKARDLLKVLMQIVPDPKDPRYQKNKTYMEYLHNEGGAADE